MKQKAVSMLLIAALAAGMLTGCGNRHTDGGYSGRAYVNEGGGIDGDAVNTLQAGSEYRIVTPMIELKEAVVDILGENYWPDALLSDEELAERTGISGNMYKKLHGGVSAFRGGNRHDDSCGGQGGLCWGRGTVSQRIPGASS